VDHAAVLEDGDLAACLIFDGLADEADRVDVLDLAAGAKRLARTANRDVDVGAHGAFVHVAVAGAEVTGDGAQLRQERLGLVSRTHVRLRDDFHQRHARAVQVDIGHGRMLVMHRLAGVLLEVQTLDANLDVLEVALAVWADRDDDRALADDRLLVLRDLVALWQIRIEIVFAVEDRLQVDLRLKAEAGANSLAHALFVDDRQHAGHGGVDEADVRIRLSTERSRGAGEQLGG